MRTFIAAVAAVVLLLATSQAGAQAPAGAGERTGEEVYREACAACHGLDGRGAAIQLVGFTDPPLPDFTDCAFGSPEPVVDWMAVAHDGGPGRAFDRRMPAYGDALTLGEIERVVERLHDFCADDAWPRGDLNFPLALVTEKAFPENETVFSGAFDTGDENAVGAQIKFEKRYGPRSQIEVAVPFDMTEGDTGRVHGLGDVKFAFKRVLYASYDRGSIFSATGEVILPTGKEALGLGKGVTIFEPFVTFGQALPGGSFIQVQTGMEASADTDRSQHEAFWRTAFGATFAQGVSALGRSWSPMVEVLGKRELAGGEGAIWDLVPQVQVSLSRRQHILFNIGVQVPVNEREGRSAQVLTYVLWDWFDGGFFEGWQ
jgi:mono/diheme cytochrome c family protein